MTFATHYFTPADGPVLHVARRGSGMPMLFQHGLCGAAAQPHEVFPFDVAAQCHSVECRGHGQSQTGALENFSIAQFTDDCASYISQTFSEPIIVGGISMGAAIALRLAVTSPHLVKGLVLARPAWLLGHAPENMRPNAEVGLLLERHDRTKAEAMFRGGDTFRRLSVEAPDNLTSLLSFFRRDPQNVTAALLQSISQDGPNVEEAAVRALAVPTLVIGHEQDAIHPLPFAKKLASLIPQAKLVEITPKATNKSLYVEEFQQALHLFLKGFPV